MQSVQVKFWEGLQGIQGIQEESGTPSSVGLQGLQSFTAYRCQAVWLDNNTPFAESNISEFTTLAAGSITLQLHNITRQGYNYIVHYLVTSTYALSNAVLSINGGQIFQGVIQGNTITFTVSGLDAGTEYLYTVTAEDIYRESATVTDTIVTTIVNEINMHYSSRTENSVVFDLSYLHDYQFVSGWIDVWNSTQDQSTDVPITNEAWSDGDTQVKVPALAAETTYKFRAGMTVEDAFGSQSTVYSSVVTATTADHDYSNDYFTIKNEYAGRNAIYLKASSQNGITTVDISTDNGATWQSETSSTSGYGTTLATLRQGESMLVRHSGAMASASNDVSTFGSENSISIGGNIASLTHSSGFNTTNLTMPNLAFRRLFMGCSVIDAENLYFGSYSDTVGEESMAMMFNNTPLVTPPSLSNFKYVSSDGMYGMFHRCTALTTAPDLTNIVNVGANAMFDMFLGCTALTVAPSFKNVETVDRQGMNATFYGCTALTTAPVFTNLTRVHYLGMCGAFEGCTRLEKGAYIGDVDTIGKQAFKKMYNGCTLLNEAYAPKPSSWNDLDFLSWLSNTAASGKVYADSLTAGIIPTDSVNGCPTGWTVQTI